MTELAGPLAIAAGVLAVGGALKLVDPAATRTMLTALRLPSGAWVARGLGLVELAAGLAALIAGGPVAAAAVAGLYLVFAGVAGSLMRADGAAASCGCFGRLSAPASWIHVAFDLVAATIAAAAAAAGTPGLVEVEVGGSLSRLSFLGLVAVGTWFGVACLTVLPATMAAASRRPARVPVRELLIHELPVHRGRMPHDEAGR